MRTTVYVETTVIGYLTARLQPDIQVAGHQATTREWWTTASERFELLISQLVLRACSAGDQQAVSERLEVLSGLALVPTTADAEELAALLIAGHAVPAVYAEDALHIALAAVHGIQYLVTWNFRHIANAAVRSDIERVCRAAGYEPTTICTPEGLMEP